MSSLPNVLSIAGSDPSGGAGIQADLKTFAALGCYGMAVITALTAQNTQGVSGVHIPPAEFVAQQIDAIFADIEVSAVKIGMLGSPDVVEAVAQALKRHGAKNIVLDPVLVATSGDSLGAPGVVEAMRAHLLPLARVVTPNIPEAMRFTGLAEPQNVQDLAVLAGHFLALGAQAVLVKGGHMQGDKASDVLFEADQAEVFSQPRVDTKNTHGTGCTLSSAIAAQLAKGLDLPRAVESAKAYLTQALRDSARLDVGHGHGPVHHLWTLTEMKSGPRS
jgi:hydroxymethylpyrimidine/phosphomethylpyrimidine kinase